MTMTGKRRSAIYNLLPLAWPFWAWGPSLTGLLLATLVFIAGYIWNAFVLAGCIVILGQAHRVGQRALLRYALWATLVGILADGAHLLTLHWLQGQVDFLLLDNPLALLVATLLVPGAIISLANLAMSMMMWRLPVSQALALSLNMGVLTSPWFFLEAIDIGREVIARQTLIGLYLTILGLGLVPWLLHLVTVWARARRLSPEWTQAMLLAALVVLLGSVSLQAWQGRAIAQPEPLPGQLAFVARGKVYLMDGRTGKKEAIASDPGSLVAWSPDGRGLLIQRQTAGDPLPHIYLLDLLNGSFTKLADGRILPNAWSPDGRSLLFTTDRPPPEDDLIWHLRLGQDPLEVTDGESPTWSPDGRRIAFSARRGGRPQIWVANPDGSDQIRLTTEGGENPAWSPNGAYIAYTFNSRVYVMNADGSGKQQLTTGEELFERNPLLAWSPDGRRLAYAHFPPPGGPLLTVIYVADLQRGEKTRYSGTYQPPLAWSPDGEWLALVRSGEVWGLHLSSNRVRRLLPGSTFLWGGERPIITVQPAPTYPPTPTPTPLPPAVVESPDILVINPKDTTIMYAGTTQGFMRYTHSGGWTMASTGILYPLRIRAIALDPSNPSILYAGTDGERSPQGGALYKSTDGGLRWMATPLRGVDIYNIAVDPLKPSIIYAGTLKGVYKSIDAGRTWQPVNKGLKSTAVRALAIDPTPPKGQSPGVSLTLYAGTQQGDIYKSLDGGANWALMETTGVPVTAMALSPLRPSVVFAATAEGLYRTNDGGATWQPLAGGIWKFKLDGVAIDPKKPSVIYVVGPRGVYKSTDGGDNWGPANIGLAGTVPTALVIDPIDPLTLYVGTNKGIFKSSNMGITWERWE